VLVRFWPSNKFPAASNANEPVRRAHAIHQWDGRMVHKFK
jgi:hypothetical protein